MGIIGNHCFKKDSFVERKVKLLTRFSQCIVNSNAAQLGHILRLYGMLRLAIFFEVIDHQFTEKNVCMDSGTVARNIWESYLWPQMICRLCSDPLLLISWRTVCARLICTPKNMSVDCHDAAMKRHNFVVGYRAQCACPQYKYYCVRDDGVNGHMGWRATILWSVISKRILSPKLDFDHQNWNRPITKII